MIRIDACRAGAHARTAGKAIVTIGVMFTLFLIAIGTILGERRR